MDIESNCKIMQETIETMLSVIEEAIKIGQKYLSESKNYTDKHDIDMMTQRIYNLSRIVGALSVADDAIMTVEAIRATHQIKIGE